MKKYNVFFKWLTAPLWSLDGQEKWGLYNRNPVIANTAEEAIKIVADEIGKNEKESELGRTLENNVLEITCKNFIDMIYIDRFELKADEII